MDTTARPSLDRLVDAVSDFAWHVPTTVPVDALHVRPTYQHESHDADRIFIGAQAPGHATVDRIADALDLPPADPTGLLARQGLYAREGGAWLGARYYLVSVYTGATS